MLSAICSHTSTQSTQIATPLSTRVWSLMPSRCLHMLTLAHTNACRTITEGTKYRIRFPEDPETVKSMLRILFLREDIHNSGTTSSVLATAIELLVVTSSWCSGLIGRSQMNRALMSLGVQWDQEDIDELITAYSKVAPQKLTCDEYLMSLQDEKLRDKVQS